MQTDSESSTPASNQYTFGAQSAAWLEGLAQRKRRPVAQSTLDTFSSRVRRLLPLIGADKPLSEINNATLRTLVDQLVQEELRPKTIGELVAIAKKIVASAVSDDGEKLFPRDWNHEFIDLPAVSKQAQPCATKEDVERAIKNAISPQEGLLYAVLSGAGLRIAEALSVHVGGTKDQTSWDAATATITVRSSVYDGQEQHRVKTEAAKRVVDLDPRLNAAIARFVVEQNIQPGAFLFQSKSGRAMHLRTATARLKKHRIPGFHSFRRFRITRLRDLGTPEDIIRFWVGHAGKDITDRYSKLAENVELRKKWALRAGLGFSLDQLGKPGTQHGKPSAKAAKPKPNARKDPKPSKPVSEESAQPEFVAQDSDLDPLFFEQPAPAPTQEELEVELARLEELRAIMGIK